MATAKQAFKTAYSTARKNSYELAYLSSDVNNQIDIEAYEFHLKDILGTSMAAAAPVAFVMWERQYQLIQTTPAQRLAAEKDVYIYD